MKDLLTIAEIAETLGMTHNNCWRVLRSNYIEPVERIGIIGLYPASVLEDLHHVRRLGHLVPSREKTHVKAGERHENIHKAGSSNKTPKTRRARS